MTILFLSLVEPGLYLRRIMDVSEINEEDGILLCQYLRWYEDGRIELDEVTYLNSDNCASSDADVVWMQYIAATSDTSTEVKISSTTYICICMFKSLLNLVRVLLNMTSFPSKH